jgi:putative transposase
LATDGEEAVAWRQQQLALMGDVSPFMKLLKQRFSVWFNRSHQRYGTLWAERFKSVLVEPKHHACRTIAAYIDLNPVRAGLATDPKDYRFCGYAEALAGNITAQQGLISVVEGTCWSQARESYRQILFGTGAGAREHASTLSAEEFQRVVKQKGKLPLASVLRHRVRYFTDGAILGSQAFVSAHLADYKRRSGGRSRSSPRPVPPIADWGDLTTLRGLRQKTFG